MRRTVPILIAALALAACTAPEPPEGALPPGIETAMVPPTTASAFIYVRPPVPAALTNETLALDNERVEWASVLLANDGQDLFARVGVGTGSLPTPPASTPDRWFETSDSAIATGPRTIWGNEIQGYWEEQRLVTLHQRFPDAWSDLVKAPASPPNAPIAAGFVRNFGRSIERFIARGGASVPGIGSDLALLRIESASFVVYGGDLVELPSSVGPGVLESLDLSVLAIARSGYPGFVVGWALDRIASTLGLETTALGQIEAHYRQVATGVHAVILRDSATLYFAIAATRDKAHELAQTVVASL